MKEIYLREANELDCDLLFHWANDKDCRLNSINQQLIPYPDHIMWFKKCMDSEYIFIYIMISDSKPVGQIRLECEGDSGRISYSVARKYRGQGYGRLLLQSLEKRIYEDGICCKKLTAEVKKENAASWKIFDELGYISVKTDHIYQYEKELKDK